MFREMKNMSRQIVCIFIVAVSLFSITIAMLAFSFQSIPQIEAAIDSQWVEGYPITLARWDSTAIPSLSFFGVTNINLRIIKEKEILNDVKIDGMDDYKIQGYYFQDEIVDSFGQVLTGLTASLISHGRLWRDSDNWIEKNGVYPIWVSAETAKSQTINIGSIYTIEFENETIHLAVEGIFNSEQGKMIGINNDIVLPYGVLSIIAKDRLLCSGVGKLAYITTYPALLSYADDNGYGISGIGSLESLVRGVVIIRYTCIGISGLMVCIAMVALMNLFQISVNSRKGFIALQKALGAANSQIVNIYAFILEIISITSILIGSVLSNFIGSILSNVVVSTSGIQTSLTISPLTVLLTVAIATLLVILLSFFLRRKICLITAIGLLTETHK